MKTANKLLSFEEYLNYDDGADSRYELVLGKLEIMNPPTVRHFLIAKFLEQVFDAEIKQQYDWLCFREAGVRTGWQKSRLPDLFIVDKSMALELLDSSAVFQTTPYLIVEIVSPESKTRDYRYKRCRGAHPRRAVRSTDEGLCPSCLGGQMRTSPFSHERHSTLRVQSPFGTLAHCAV